MLLVVHQAPAVLMASKYYTVSTRRITRSTSHRWCVGRCWSRPPAHVLRLRSPAVTVTSKPRPVLGVALNAIRCGSTAHLDPISVVSRLAGAALITDTCTDHEGLCDSSTQKEAKLRLRGCWCPRDPSSIQPKHYIHKLWSPVFLNKNLHGSVPAARSLGSILLLPLHPIRTLFGCSIRTQSTRLLTKSQVAEQIFRVRQIIMWKWNKQQI
jgi:hypothetical protein